MSRTAFVWIKNKVYFSFSLARVYTHEFELSCNEFQNPSEFPLEIPSQKSANKQDFPRFNFLRSFRARTATDDKHRRVLKLLKLNLKLINLFATAGLSKNWICSLSLCDFFSLSFVLKLPLAPHLLIIVAWAEWQHTNEKKMKMKGKCMASRRDGGS